MTNEELKRGIRTAKRLGIRTHAELKRVMRDYDMVLSIVLDNDFPEPEHYCRECPTGGCE